MAYIFPHDPYYDEIIANGRTPNAKTITCGGLVWQKRKDINGPYFASIGAEPEYFLNPSEVPPHIREAYANTEK